jgi:hypothetical protein
MRKLFITTLCHSLSSEIKKKIPNKIKFFCLLKGFKKSCWIKKKSFEKGNLSKQVFLELFVQASISEMVKGKDKEERDEEEEEEEKEESFESSFISIFF